MYTPDSSLDDRFFYNPMNSLSESDADQTIQNKSSLISEQPAIVAKKAGTIVDPSQRSIDQKQMTNNPEAYKDVKMPEQSFNKEQPMPAQKKQQQLAQPSQYNKTQKPSDPNLKTQEPQQQSTRKRPRIFDPLGEDKLDSSSFLRELNKMGGDEVRKKHILVKEVQTAEDLILQKQLFLFTNYNEKNVQQYVEKAKDILDRYTSYQEQVLILQDYNQQLNELAPHCLVKDVSLLDQASEDKRRKQARDAFKVLYSQIARLETASRADVDQECSEIIQAIKDELEIRLKLQFAIENLTRLKPQLSLLKNNRNFQLEFQTYLELIKAAQRLESEKIRSQFEFVKSSIKARAQKIYNLLD